MLNIVGSLLQRKSRSITTRIPHQSENAFGAFPDSFPPGEAICAAARRCRPFGATLFRHGYRRATFPKGEGLATLNNNLSYKNQKKV